MEKFGEVMKDLGNGFSCEEQLSDKGIVTSLLSVVEDFLHMVV